MNGRRLPLSCVLVALILGSPALAWAQQPSHPVLDAPGFRQNRDYFSEMPFEHIDTLGGNLVLTFTDLVLPGNAGRELRFQRTYNSKTGAWSFGIAGIPLRISNPPIPQAETPGFQEATPALHMSDGSVRKMAWNQPPNVNVPESFEEAISSEFWIFNRAGATRRLSMPHGDTCHYEADVEQYMLRVTSCKDLFNNEIEFDWQPSSGEWPLVVTQHLGAASRVITLTFDASATFPISMVYDGRTWNYTPTNVTAPEGLAWQFTYSGLDLVSMTTPHGGVISYTYDDEDFEGPESPQVLYSTHVVRTRSTSGNDDIEPGTWTYHYQITQNGISGITRVRTPSGRLRYQHGTTESPLAVFDAEGGVVPLVSRAVQRAVVEAPDVENDNHWEDVESEARTYTLQPVLSWWNFGTLELETRTITRHGGGTPTDYVTSFNYRVTDFGDYHRPMLITETGPAGTRSTVRSYQHSTSPYLVGLPLTEAVTVGSETFSKSWTYNSSNGFKESETIYEITTYFGEGSYGNVGSVTKASGKWISYESYQFGRPRRIRTPEYIVTRTINPDGTIASQTGAGRTTTFTYDDLARPLVTQPPGETAPTSIEYHTGGEWVKTTRGSSVVTTTLDGFGRPIKTVNAVGIVTKTKYDAEGRMVGEGYPHLPVPNNPNFNIETQIEYDALGRVTARVNPDTSRSERSYLEGGVVVEAKDEEDRTTSLQWEAFGNPDDARLVGIRGADLEIWAYSYDALGRLINVDAPDATSRSWVFNQGLLESETHPESGLTSYSYDAAGVLATKTDANQTTTTYTYDGNDRVETITALGRQTTIVYEVGSDNRESATNPSAKAYWRYDPATGRLQFRQDTIDGKVFTTLFEYDNNDNLTALVYPSGRRVQYVVNAGGQPERVHEPAANRDYATGITYHPSGGVLSYSSSNGITTTIGYDDKPLLDHEHHSWRAPARVQRLRQCRQPVDDWGLGWRRLWADPDL